MTELADRLRRLRERKPRATSASLRGREAALATYKVSSVRYENPAFNLTPSKSPPDEIKADNGSVRPHGTRFDEPSRHADAVGRAFNSLRVQRNSDFLNELGEGMIGVVG